MSPRVGSDLVAIGIHSLNGSDEAICRKIDLTLGEVVTGDEEGGHGVVRDEKV
jgi:hypothetical protein